MGVKISWRSKQGPLTDDNRDYCGVGMRDDSTLCVVLDGSTSGPKSGEFARLIARDLIDWFVPEGNVTAEAIMARLRDIHSDLSPMFRTDSASVVIALIEGGHVVQLLNAGDCLAGLRAGVSAVDWRTRPHTLANAIDDLPITDIARSPVRSRLTRSFRGRKFVAPDVSELRLDGDQTLVLATDGFWAALDPEAQARFLAGEELPDNEKPGRDDCSALSLRIVDGQESNVSREASDNLYVVDTSGS